MRVAHYGQTVAIVRAARTAGVTDGSQLLFWVVLQILRERARELPQGDLTLGRERQQINRRLRHWLRMVCGKTFQHEVRVSAADAEGADAGQTTAGVASGPGCHTGGHMH